MHAVLLIFGCFFPPSTSVLAVDAKLPPTGNSKRLEWMKLRFWPPGDEAPLQAECARLRSQVEEMKQFMAAA